MHKDNYSDILLLELFRSEHWQIPLLQLTAAESYRCVCVGGEWVGSGVEKDLLKTYKLVNKIIVHKRVWVQNGCNEK